MTGRGEEDEIWSCMCVRVVICFGLDGDLLRCFEMM